MRTATRLDNDWPTWPPNHFLCRSEKECSCRSSALAPQLPPAVLAAGPAQVPPNFWKLQYAPSKISSNTIYKIYTYRN